MFVALAPRIKIEMFLFIHIFGKLQINSKNIVVLDPGRQCEINFSSLKPLGYPID